MAVSGSITRRMGRFDSEASPTSVVANGQLARIPDSRRIVVPEFAGVERRRRGAAAPARPAR